MKAKLILAAALLGFIQATPIDDICGQTIDASKGSTRTINFHFDDNYPANANCEFHLTGTGAERLRITFLEFDVEKHSRCSFDYLEVFDGRDTRHSPTLGRFCGYDNPSPIVTRGNQATLKFVSDRTLSKTGFILQFTPQTTQRFIGECEPMLTKTTGSLQSPLYPQNYPNRVNCTYQIAPTSGNMILITFPTFKIESSSNCIMDYVRITTRTGEQIGPRLCGDLGGNSYIVPGSHAFVQFVTDRSSTRLGFELHYRTIASCDDLSDVCTYGCTLDNHVPRCSCKNGYQAPNGEAQCYDVNECKTNNGGCEDHCTNTDGSYECECLRDGLILSPDRRNCTDRTCSIDNAGCEQNCHLLAIGGYHCTCNLGYEIADDRHNCTDIDECTSTTYPDGCEQICRNEPGSYYCDCRDGYILSTNSRTCEDINECVTEGSNCEQDCINVPGGWSCSCYEGYEVNPFDHNGCQDIDECDEERKPAHCTECVNYEGGFACTTCDYGFALFVNDSGCADVNECETNNGGCQQECVNTMGSYHCACYTGQALVPGKEDKGICDDINECAANNGRGPCQHYCENLIGSFRCLCLDGFRINSLNGIECQDIDECSITNGNCQQNCSNTVGSFQCSCYSGYRSDNDGPCVDIDECVEVKPCDADLGAECINQDGSFLCQCPSGYTTVDQTVCQDVDECAPGPYGPTHGCPQQCVNTDGSFQCTCFPGYTKYNHTCADVNECSQSLCDHNEFCHNTLGSFTCGCRSGYFLVDDGRSCSDIDECAGNSGTTLCTQICLNEIGTHKCACREGYYLGSDNYTCFDINECVMNTSGCSDGCVNHDGSFQCYCHQGYEFAEGSNKTCVDTDECASDNGGCHHVCDNTMGSFRCSCLDGYIAGLDSRCHDVNECATNNGGCDQACHNFNGTYNCSCDPDFKLGDDERSCGHCPDCATFEMLQSDVEVLKSSQVPIYVIRESYSMLAVKVANLEEKVRLLTERLDRIG